MNKPFYSLSEIARRCNVVPRVLSDLFYQRQLDESRCPTVGGRRLVPADYLAEIQAVLCEIAKKKNRVK